LLGHHAVLSYLCWPAHPISAGLRMDGGSAAFFDGVDALLGRSF
jgi:hypothetical protein